MESILGSPCFGKLPNIGVRIRDNMILFDISDSNVCSLPRRLVVCERFRV